VSITVDESKAEVAEAEGDDLLGEDHGLDDDLRQHVVDGLITRQEADEKMVQRAVARGAA